MRGGGVNLSLREKEDPSVRGGGIGPITSGGGGMKRRRCDAPLEKVAGASERRRRSIREGGGSK